MPCANPGLPSLSLHRVFKKASPNGKVSLRQLHPSSCLTPNACPLSGMSPDHAGPCASPSEAVRRPWPQGRGPQETRSQDWGGTTPLDSRVPLLWCGGTRLSQRLRCECRNQRSAKGLRGPAPAGVRGPWSLSMEPGVLGLSGQLPEPVLLHLFPQAPDSILPSSQLSTRMVLMLVMSGPGQRVGWG